MGLINKKNATIFLFVNSILWGSSYVWFKLLLGFLPRFSILFVCSLGSLTASVIIFRRYLHSIKIQTILISILISIFSVISNTFFIMALQYTSSSNTAFIVQLSVIITPVLLALIERKLPESRVIIGAVIAVAGLFLLTCDFESFAINSGDLFALGNALFFSIFLVGMGLSAKKVPTAHFSVIYHSINTSVFFAAAILTERQLIQIVHINSPLVITLIAVSIAITAATVFIQGMALKFVNAGKANLIYTFEPVAAMMLAVVFIGERPNGFKAIEGAFLIMLSVIYSSHRPAERVASKLRNTGFKVFSRKHIRSMEN